MKSFLLKLKALGKKASNKFNQLSSSVVASMDMQAQLKVVFDLIDSNGDGKISPIELREVMLRLGHNKSTLEGEIEGMVKEVDLDGDGEIDFIEFTQAVTGGGPKDYDQALVEAFEVFDRDGNGLISARELRRVLVGLGYSKCSLKECRLMIRAVDKNGDGMVDFKEFKSMMSLLKEE
ncbi:hypothetical protein LUZ62_051927 [Rhynchospora pubera]|uniref:EF-hand domain-containing protein n=1 Tax=Rhynchospora pubera TaxID=906938 RepID=A0AAV8BVP7_9POAL|nr:hypothetical protein LUZ62_081637 [Rhynchospora pubera]KAJ4759843.1 hypothetical protein LUZ62_070218 [Rhynchospora pubera]KAJ4800681.1 hypothetical protein LUZ62_051927 [Rhynchospora pubera]